MRTGEEFEENRRVDREVAAHAKRPESSEAADGREIGRAGGDEAENARDAEGQVEAPAASKDVAAKPPKHGTGEEAYVLGQGQ